MVESTCDMSNAHSPPYNVFSSVVTYLSPLIMFATTLEPRSFDVDVPFCSVTVYLFCGMLVCIMFAVSVMTSPIIFATMLQVPS